MLQISCSTIAKVVWLVGNWLRISESRVLYTLIALFAMTQFAI